MLAFDSKTIVDKFISCKERFILIADSNSNLLQETKLKFEQQFLEYENRGFLTVAFIGEYGAGKSTIISALTGRKDIKISADISTLETAEYDWNGIKIIDTPGLFTDRLDHDEITYNKIKESDLLIFTITHKLFDFITVANFKELAFQYNYKNKMMLVVNKLSSEAGDDETKICNYKDSLQKALDPHSLASFPVAFVDAFDYLEGIEERDSELQDLSRFDSFIDVLNQFTSEKKIYAKLDTPVRLLGATIDDSIQLVARDDLGDNAQLELLKSLSKILLKERRRLSGELGGIVLGLNNKIQSQSVSLTSILGSDKDFEARCADAELEIQKLIEEAVKLLEKAVQSSKDNLRADIQEVFDKELFEEFIFDKNIDVSVNVSDVSQIKMAKNIKENTKKFKDIAVVATTKIGNIAVKGGKDIGFAVLKNPDVSGSHLHIAVKTVGHSLGHKFVPFEAIKITKAIGNVSKFAGPALSFILLGMDVVEVKEDEKNARKLSEARKNITATFQGISNDIEAYFKEQLKIAFDDYIVPIEDEIKKVREAEQLEISKSSELVSELMVIRKELDNILLTVI
jgi:hypothetical protein